MSEIYALCCPATGEVRYIGKANDSARRLKSHMRDSRRRNTPVYCWIRSLAGAVPVMLVLARVDDWKAAERSFIAQYRAQGARLLNLADGGDEPHCSTLVRQANAHRLNERLARDPTLAFVQLAKRQLGTALRFGQLPEGTRATMRECARANPRMFGEWANA